MSGLGGFHTSHPFLKRSDAALTNRIRKDISEYGCAMQREREKQEVSAKESERLKKEREKIIKATKKKLSPEEEPEEVEEEEDDGSGNPPQKTQKSAAKDPMLQAVQPAKVKQEGPDSFRRGSHFGAKHTRLQEFGTHPMTARSWERTSDAVFVSLKPLAAPPVEGPTRLGGHVPKTDKGFWRRAPGAINKVPPPSPKRTIPRLEPADHAVDPFDHPPFRSWLHEEPPLGSSDVGLFQHTFTSYSRRKTQWPCKHEGRGIAPPMWAI